MKIRIPGTLESSEGKHWLGYEANFFLSQPHKCEYLDNTEAMTLFTNPSKGITPAIYEHLLENGFRRSGEFIYRPYCLSCNGCISVRVPVANFRMSRNMKRVWKRNGDLDICSRKAMSFSKEHIQLYQKYIHTRHQGGSMDYPDPNSCLDFWTSSWMETDFYEFRRAGKLLMVAVVDHFRQGLSAVYTFYDPGESGRSLGTFGVLWEIDQARRQGKKWLYLGYWISNCHKMRYKSRFSPLEAFQKGRWDPLDVGKTGK